MVRPRESFDQRLIAVELRIDPEPSEIRWLQDVFGNAVAVASFTRRARTLVFDSRVTLEHAPAALQTVDIEAYARNWPFTYSSEDLPDLLRSIERQHHDPQRIIDEWAQGFVQRSIQRDARTDTLALLSAITAAIHRDFTYIPRAAHGTQTPIETLQRRSGTCRDYAMLMIEAVRALGFAARFVSGYVYSPHQRDLRVGGGNTHAWVRVYIPGSGWVEFDPTNGIIGNTGLIRVAIARDLYQAVPISGTWNGFPGSYEGMDVTVAIDVAEANPLPTPAPVLRKTA